MEIKSSIIVGDEEVTLLVKVGDYVVELQASQDSSVESIIEALVNSDDEKIKRSGIDQVAIEKLKAKAWVVQEQKQAGEDNWKEVTQESLIRDLTCKEQPKEDEENEEENGEKQKVSRLKLYWDEADEKKETTEVQVLENED